MCLSASLTVCRLIDVVSSKGETVMAASFMRCILSSSSHREDAVEVDSETHHIIQPPAQPVKEEPKGPEGPITEPANSIEVSPKPTECAALVPEQVLPPSGKPQPEGGDEEKPAEVVAGVQDSLVNKKEPVCTAEKQLWATVEETAAEGGKELSEEKVEKQEEGGVRGG